MQALPGADSDSAAVGRRCKLTLARKHHPVSSNFDCEKGHNSAFNLNPCFSELAPLHSGIRSDAEVRAPAHRRWGTISVDPSRQPPLGNTPPPPPSVISRRVFIILAHLQRSSKGGALAGIPKVVFATFGSVIMVYISNSSYVFGQLVSPGFPQRPPLQRFPLELRWVRLRTYGGLRSVGASCLGARCVCPVSASRPSPSEHQRRGGHNATSVARLSFTRVAPG